MDFATCAQTGGWKIASVYLRKEDFFLQYKGRRFAMHGFQIAMFEFTRRAPESGVIDLHPD